MSKPKPKTRKQRQKGGMENKQPGGLFPAAADPAQDIPDKPKPNLNPFGPQPPVEPKLEVPKDIPDDIPGPATQAADDQEAKIQKDKQTKYDNCIKKCDDEKNETKKSFFDFSWLFGPKQTAGGKRASRRKLKHKKGK